MVDTHKKCLNSVRYWKTICLTINGKHPKPSSEKNAIGMCNGIGQTRDNAAYRIRISIWEHETGEFFTEMLKKFSQEKDKEGRKQEYTARKQRRNEDPRKYCILHWQVRVWIQAYAPAKRSLGEFKNAMIMGLSHMELKRTCLQFMPKVLQYSVNNMFF